MSPAPTGKLRVAAIRFLNPAPLMWNFEHAPEQARLAARYDIYSTLPARCADDLASGAAARRKQPWPATLPDQVRAVKDSLRATPLQNPAQIAAGFRPASRTRIQEILETLTALGQTRHSEGRYSL